MNNRTGSRETRIECPAKCNRYVAVTSNMTIRKHNDDSTKTTCEASGTRYRRTK